MAQPSPDPGGSPANPDAAGFAGSAGRAPIPGAQVSQESSAYDSAQQATLGKGNQYNYFGPRGAEPEAAISIAPPLGQRSDDLPLRGRDGLLTDLSAPGPRVRVLHGLGGCGKTRVALEVAYLAEQAGTETWWVSAADRNTLEAGMRSLGRRLGLTDAELSHGDAADRIWHRLSTRQAPWLLIIDNADDPLHLAGPDRSIANGWGWLRPVHRQTGAVLVTTRDGRPASWAPWCARHRLTALSTTAAALMLTDYAGGRPSLGSEADAEELASRLGGLPLALKIAGSYLADSAATPLAYADPDQVRTYRQYKEALDTRNLTTVFPAPDGPMTQDQARTLIGKTWDLTLDLLQSRQMPEGRPLLRLLATFADAPIPHELLLNPPALASSEFFPSVTGPRLWEILRTLDAFGLIDLTPGSESPPALPTARLHPLVRDSSQPSPGDRLSFLRLAVRLLERAVRALSDETSPPENPQSWPVWQLLTSHCTTVFSSLTAEPDSPDDSTRSAAYAAYMAARYLTARSAYSQAESLCREILTAQLRVIGPDNSSTLVTRHSIARLTAERGNHRDAETEYRDILTAQLRVLGPDHIDTLITRHQIALEMTANGNDQDAESEHRDILAAELSVFGPDHPETLTTRHAIALITSARGDHQAAEDEHRQILAARTRVLGADHPDTLITQHCIAYEMAERGDNEAAEPAYRAVLAAEMRVLGPSHPITLGTRHEIARLMAIRGDRQAAQDEFRDILTARQGILGADHASTRVTAEWVEYLEEQKEG